MTYLKAIKQRCAAYCKSNIARLPVSREYNQLKKQLAITSFYQLPEAYQQRVNNFVSKHKPSTVYLVGSLASGAGIIPGVTPGRFVELRKKYSHKPRKRKSDIDLYMLASNGHTILAKSKNKVVNIESLPAKFEPAVLIYQNGEFI